jgi:hypothetical protein
MKICAKYQNLNNKIQSLKNNTTLTNTRTEDNDTFYARTIFTGDETQLLNKGLKYNLHYKHKNWIETLAIEADTAIRQTKKSMNT